MTTLKEKLQYLAEFYPEIYKELCTNVPALVENPSSASAEDLAEYNRLVNAIEDDDVYPLFHKVG